MSYIKEDPSKVDWSKVIRTVTDPLEGKRFPRISWDDALADLLGQVSATMKERHAKYGPGNIAEHGMVGIKVRLGDKYARLTAGGLDYEDESLRDTFLDLIGYAVIGIMWLDKTWPGSEDK